MNPHNLKRLLNPLSIAVVGASDRKPSIGRSLLENFRDEGYKGSVYPINPNRDSILGLKAYPSLSDLGQPIDLVIIITRIDTVPDLIKECGAVGVGGAIVISGGGKESGEQGVRIEADIGREARKGRIRILGPNCLGILNTRANLNASFAHVLPKQGRLAFVSQSGGVTAAFLDFAADKGIGCSYVVSVGSMLDVDFGDVIQYLGDDPDTGAILIYAESLTNHRKLVSIAMKMSLVKPIFLLKVGRSCAAAKAAFSHTGALAGNEAVHEAAFKRAGIVQIDSLDDLFDCADMLAKRPRPTSPALAIVTNTGGPGVMAVDHMAVQGFEPPQMSQATLDKLNAILSPFWSHGNPVDILGDATPEMFRQAGEICADASEFDALLFMNTPQAQVPSAERARALCEAFKDADLPVLSAWIGTQEVLESRDLFKRACIPTYDSPGRAIRAFLNVYRYEQLRQAGRETLGVSSDDLTLDNGRARQIVVDALAAGRKILTEAESKDLLNSYGIPTTPTKRAASAEQAAQLAEEIGYPVVLKLDSEDLSHKSDAGGVKLSLMCKADVHRAFDEIMNSAQRYAPNAQISGVTVQSMVLTEGHELILGIKKDPHFGPVIIFGMGGVLAEFHKDREIALPPLNSVLARRLMASTKVYRLLEGFRDLPRADLNGLEEILIRLSRLVEAFPEIVELDINPLLAFEEGALVLDARLELGPSEVDAPLHLALLPEGKW